MCGGGSMHGGGACVGGCVTGGHLWQGACVAGGMCGRGHVWQRGAVADPGFCQGGGANSPGGRQHTNLSNFSKNCMKLKEFGPPGARASPAPPLDPPLGCACKAGGCACVAGETATAADGTHPTGMHSCLMTI